MDASLEVLIKLLSLVAIIIATIKIWIKIMNRSIIEIILASSANKQWDDFVEVLFAVLFLICSSTVPFTVLDLQISNTVMGLLIMLNLSVFVVSVLFLAICGVIYFISNRFKTLLKTINVFVSINMFSIFTSLFLGTISYRSQILAQIDSNNYSKLSLAFCIVYIFFIVAFYFYRSVHIYFNGSQNAAYKVEEIDSKEISELCFIFALDNERHIFIDRPLKRNKLKLPVYLYYPKEKVLYKYSKYSM